MASSNNITCCCISSMNAARKQKPKRPMKTSGKDKEQQLAKLQAAWKENDKKTKKRAERKATTAEGPKKESFAYVKKGPVRLKVLGMDGSEYDIRLAGLHNTGEHMTSN